EESAPLMRLPWKKKSSVADEKALAKQEDEKKKEVVKKVSIIQLFRYAHKLDVFLLVLGGTLAIITGLGMPMLSIVMGTVTQNFIDATTQMMNATTYNDPVAMSIALDNFSNSVIQSCIEYAIVGVAIFIAASIQVSCYLTACERMTDRLRRDFVRAVLRQDVAWFDQSHSGTLASKLFDNLERVREGTGDKVALLIQYTAQFLGGFIVAFSYDWRLTLIMMSLSPFMIICGGFIAKLMASATAEEARKYAIAGGIAEEVLSSVRTVHAFNAQHHEVARYEKALEEGKADGIKKSLVVGAGLACTFLIIFASYCLAFWVGTDYVAWRWMEAGTVMTVFFAVMMGSMALGSAGPQFAIVGAAQGAASTLHEIIDRVPEIDSYSKEGIVPPTTRGHVQFENVRFSYPNRPEAEILKGISVDCAPGQTVAFVGSSGCGKSTSISLMLRYYDPTHGKIMIDGTDLRDLNIEYLRKTIGVVSQEPILFDTTIEENIRFGNPDVTKNEMYDALKRANAYDFVQALPEGVKTLVGTRGTQLSGGQKQRIAIARALVRNPKILLLDEATSALDAHSERVVQEALENASRGRTTFIVAHRLSTIRNADAILVFKDGVVVEKGRHDELIRLGGHYHALVNSQVFTDIDNEPQSARTEEGGGAVSARRYSQDPTSPKSPREYEEVAVEEKEKDLDRLKKELEAEGIERVSLFGILKYAKPEWGFIFIAFVASSVQGVVFPIFSLFFTDIINVFSLLDTDVDEMVRQGHMYALLFLALGGLNAVTMLTSSFFFGLVSERLTMRLRLAVFKNILSMQISYMDEPKHAPGKLCTRLATDAPMVKSALDFRLGQVCGSVIGICAGLGIAFYYGWQMALLMIGIFPLAAVGQAIQVKYIRNRASGDNANLETAGKIATEAMENVRTVHALTLEPNVVFRFNSLLDGPLQTATRKALMQGLSYGFSSSIFYFLYAAAFRFGLWLIMEGYSDPMLVLKVLFAISFTAGSAGMASAYFPEYVKATFAAGLIFKMMNTETQIDGMGDDVGSKGELNGAITLKAVHFEYEQRKGIKVLNGLDLKVEPGQTVALVGPSGCGKSTVVSLLERFYEPTGGDLIVDGVPLDKRNLRDVRRQIAIVNQEPILFDMTIRENIGYGVATTEDDIIAAAKMANAHNFVSAMPAGYETRVGEKGIQLSGGQKQRIAIARALVRNPRILLLDEATSALDMESEKIVQDALDEASTGRTCIVIAHRLATIVGADKIVVVNEGRIVEQGTHAELLEKKGVYYSLSKKQAKKVKEVDDEEEEDD
ncbi:hypothetical protein PFISCL1PPCAC_16200, partial [Pristionchus fissidentatus]